MWQLLGADEAREAVVKEARLAFRHNVDVYTEEGDMWSGAAKGVANMAGGFARERLRWPRSGATAAGSE